MARDEAVTRQRVESFERGECGLSVRGLVLRATMPSAAHAELLARGFRCLRYAIPTVRTRTAEPRWRSTAGVTTKRDDPEIASEYLYVHGDGGAVRIFPTRRPSTAYDEITRGPFARKSILMPTALRSSFRDEACVVTDADNALPRCLRSSAGLKFDPTDLVASHRLAETALAEQVIPITSDPPPSVPLSEGTSLGAGFTVIAGGDFWDLAREVREAARHQVDMVLESEAGGDVTLFFTGSSDVGRRLRQRGSWPGLASLTLHQGTAVLGIDPFGYEASVNQLATFLATELPRIPNVLVLENATGRDVTKSALRFPAELLGPEGPTST